MAFSWVVAILAAHLGDGRLRAPRTCHGVCQSGAVPHREVRSHSGGDYPRDLTEFPVRFAVATLAGAFLPVTVAGGLSASPSWEE
jgi:hypothetical protein